jgi:hypothetical protein
MLHVTTPANVTRNHTSHDMCNHTTHDTCNHTSHDTYKRTSQETPKPDGITRFPNKNNFQSDITHFSNNGSEREL